MEAFSFTADDLKTNQDGLISSGQQKRLRGMGKNLTNYSKFSIKFMVVFVTVMFGMIPRSGRRQ